MSPIVLILGWISAPASFTLLNGSVGMNVIPVSYSDKILHVLSAKEKLLGVLVSIIPLYIELLVLYFLIRLFRLYEKGEIFSLSNVRYIRKIAYTLLLGELLANPVYEFLMGLVLTLQNPPGHRMASITFNQTNFGILLIALFTILISWVMAEGCKLREEQQLTI